MSSLDFKKQLTMAAPRKSYKQIYMNNDVKPILSR